MSNDSRVHETGSATYYGLSIFLNITTLDGFERKLITNILLTRSIVFLKRRTLMKESIEDILGTFPEHEAHLTDLYKKHIRHLVNE